MIRAWSENELVHRNLPTRNAYFSHFGDALCIETKLETYWNAFSASNTAHAIQNENPRSPNISSIVAAKKSDIPKSPLGSTRF